MDYLNTFLRLKALSETGLVYAQNGYEIERNQEMLDISKELLAAIGKIPIQTLNDFYLPQKDYPTPKVDVRGFVLNQQNEILFAKEKQDGKWAIPGGWADIGHTASEIAVKEVQEETGIEVNVERVLAIYDKRCHPHPPAPFYVYRIVFLCRMTGGALRGNFDIEEARWFPVDELPELSTHRILDYQVKQLFELAHTPNAPVHFD